MDLVGRRDVLDRISQVETPGNESALLIVAERGAGRSSLLASAQSRATGRAVLLRSMPTEAGWALSGFSRVLSSISDSRAGDLGTKITQRPPDPAGGMQAAHDLLASLRGLGLDPVLVLIDDIDLMDEESQTVLGFLSGRLAGTGLRLVASATRVDAPSPLSAFPRLDLPPLTDAESREVAARAAGPSGDPGTLGIVAAHAGGNPGAVTEIIRTLTDGQRRGTDPIVLPFRPSAAIRTISEARVAGLGEPQRTMLDRIALAPLSHLSALARRGSDDADALEDLLYSGFVVTRGQHIRMTDPMLRSYLYWTMESRTRRRLHAEIAAAHSEADARLQLWHESFAEDPPPAADLLVAAIEYVAEGDTGSAVEFAERALRMATSVDEHLAEIIDLSTGFFLRAELELASRYVLHARRESTSAARNLRLSTILVSINYAKTQTVPADDIDASISLYAGEDPGGAVRLRSLAATFHAERWEVEEARDQIVRANPLIGMVGQADRDSLDGAKLLADAVDGAPTGFDGILDGVDGAAVAAMSTRAMIVLGRTLSLRERYAEARQVFTIALNQPQPPEPILDESARYFLATNELRSGDLRRAQAAAQDWHSIAPRGLVERSSRMLLRAWSLHSAGDTEAAQDLFDRCLEQSSIERNQAVAAQLLAFQGTRALMEEVPAESVRLLELADVLGAHFRNPALVRHSVDLIEAYVSAKRMREAHAVLRSLHAARAARPSRWLTLAIGRAEGLVAPDDGPIRLFQEAVSQFGAADSQYELGRLLTNLARAQERFGLARDGAGSLAAARSAFERAGALSWAASSGRVPEGPADAGAAAILDLLTEEERLIAEKVCQGYRNKEIAAALYISLRTVELRLTRIYRKVGARSRSHLVAFLN